LCGAVKEPPRICCSARSVKSMAMAMGLALRSVSERLRLLAVVVGTSLLLRGLSWLFCREKRVAREGEVSE